MPTEELFVFQMAFRTTHPALDDAYCVLYGLKLYLKQIGEFVIQNMFNNRCTHDRDVGKVLVLATSGVFIACSFNAPGDMHGSTIAEWSGVNSKLQKLF